MYYYLLMLVIIVISIGLFWMAGLPKIKTKNLSFIMIGLGLNGVTIPVSSFNRYNGSRRPEQHYI